MRTRVGMMVMSSCVTVTAVAIIVIPGWNGLCCCCRVLVPMIVVVMGMVMIVGHQSASEWGSAMCSSMSASTPETC